MSTKLASGYIDLSVKYSSAQKQIANDIIGLNKTAAKSGDAAGKSYSGSFSSAMREGVNTSSITGMFSRFQGEAKKSGNAAGYVAGRAMGAGVTAGLTAATAGLAAVVGGISTTLFKGFQRYKSLDATSKRLQAMGKSSDDVKSILGDINSVVEGTPIALDAASKSATMFLQGGVKQGKELKSVLGAIADVAGSSGGDFSELAIIFSQVMNKGKLQAEEMLQLNERNIPIQKWLQTELGVTGDVLTKMSKDGKISFQDLVNAVQTGAGGMAKKMGDTIDGALGNMQTAVARTGANFLSAIFGDPMSTTEGPGGMAQAINRVTEKINGLNNWVVAHKDDIKQFFTDVMGVAKGLAGAVGEVSTFLKEHPGLIAGVATAFAAWKTIAGVSALITNLQTISGLLGVGGGKGGRGGRGILGGLGALAAAGGAAGIAADGKTSGWDAAATIGGTTLLGAQLGGLPGAAAGAVVGTGIAVAPTLINGQEPSAASQATDLGTGLPDSQAHAPAGTRESGGLPKNSSTGLPSAQANAPAGARESGGVPGTGLKPTASGLFSRYSGQGFQVGGYSANVDQPWDEHQTGEAVDVMVPNTAAGNAALADALAQPGVRYVLWNQKQWNPDGTSIPMTDRGSPTENHLDHLHIRTYDSGGWWPDGVLGINTTGEDEFVLSPDHLDALANGVDPNTVVHGTGNRALPGPVKGSDGAKLPDMVRTEGYIPAAAGHSGKSGNSFLSGIYGIGGDIVKGVIDQAASTASSAAGMALTAGTMGAGAAGGPAASGAAQAAIGMGTQAAKRGVDWVTDLLGIWTDATIEQLTPFGAPRWISTDPTAFMPTTVMPAITSSIEQAFLQSNGQQHEGTGALPGPAPVEGLQVGQPVGNPAPQIAGGPGGELDPTANGGGVNDYSVHMHDTTVTDVKALTQEAKDQQMLQAMRYAGRP